MNQGDYARLGNACYSSMRVLTSNQKFLQPSAQIYDSGYTNMYQYPAMSYDYMTTVGDIEKPEDIKTKKQDETSPQQREHYKSCCGRK